MPYLLIIISVTFTTLGQILQKLAANKIKERLAVGKPILLAVMTPYFFLGILTLGLGAFTWLLVLSRMELSLAYPMMSLGYVLVTFFSKYLFKETVPPHRWAGIATIIFGIILISRS